MGRGHLARAEKKGAARGAWLCFEDEAGTGLTGQLVHTWAPVGQTPVLPVVKGRQPKLSLAALCCYRPGHTPRLLSRTKRGWWHDTDLIRLLDQAHQQLQDPLIVIWDRLGAHRSHRMRRAIAARPWLEVEYLPAYAPELNPTEGVWSTLKRTALANLAARTLTELTNAVHTGLGRIRRQPSLLTNLLTHAGLEHP